MSEGVVTQAGYSPAALMRVMAKINAQSSGKNGVPEKTSRLGKTSGRRQNGGPTDLGATSQKHYLTETMEGTFSLTAFNLPMFHRSSTGEQPSATATYTAMSKALSALLVDQKKTLRSTGHSEFSSEIASESRLQHGQVKKSTSLGRPANSDITGWQIPAKQQGHSEVTCYPLSKLVQYPTIKTSVQPKTRLDSPVFQAFHFSVCMSHCHCYVLRCPRTCATATSCYSIRRSTISH